MFLRIMNKGEEAEATVGQFSGPWVVRVGTEATDVVSVLWGKVVTQLDVGSV
jgi:hypothetical protein